MFFLSLSNTNKDLQSSLVVGIIQCKDHALVATRKVEFVISARYSCSRDHLRHKLTFFSYADFANLLTPDSAAKFSTWAVVIR